MEHQAEINRFAIFLFCLLVPLGSSAPTDVSKEGKITTGQGQKHFTTDIKTKVGVLEKQATDLFNSYNNCVSEPLQDETQLLNKPEAIDMAREIPDCPPFHADCCALNHIHKILQGVKGEMEILCHENLHDLLNASLNQLDTTLGEGTAFYTCKDQARPRELSSRIQAMNNADKMSYILWVLKTYKQMMQNIRKIYSEAAN